MAITEQNRRDIFNGLEGAIGSDAANHLMELLPHTPAAHLVTREDMHANTLALRGEMAELRAELKGEVAELRAELRGEMAELRGDFHVDLAELRTELRTDMSKLRVDMQRLVGAGMVANTVALVTALVI